MQEWIFPQDHLKLNLAVATQLDSNVNRYCIEDVDITLIRWRRQALCDFLVSRLYIVLMPSTYAEAAPPAARANGQVRARHLRPGVETYPRSQPVDATT